MWSRSAKVISFSPTAQFQATTSIVATYDGANTVTFNNFGDPNGYNYGGGYSGYADFNDLQGQERNYATGQLASRGFLQLDNKKTDTGRYMTYWRSQSRQCLILNSQNGYVVSIESVSPRTCRD